VFGAGNQQGRPTVRSEPSEAIRPASNRAVAQAAGDLKYRGRACKCGETQRYTKTGQCVPCAIAYGKRWHHEERLDGIEFVYECFSSDGELLYIGRTNSPRKRFYNHTRSTKWWDEVARVAWTQAPNLEHRRIIDGKPKYNKRGV
jgi:GIY-YIG catalytic domain